VEKNLDGSVKVGRPARITWPIKATWQPSYI
jgi:hypothetical protein